MSNSDVVLQQSIQQLSDFIRAHFSATDKQAFIPLHAPCFDDNEKRLLNDCIDSTFVSSVGKYVDQFEQNIAEYTGAKHAVAVVNGTMALFLALKVVGVQPDDLVLTQSLTFVATANAIKMANAEPVFIDVDRHDMALSIDKLTDFLEQQTEQKNGVCFHKSSGKRISACVPMHTLGFCGRIEQLVELCHRFGIKVVEDAAESLGTFYSQQHSGTFADIGVFSFNGNKIITTGGGGMLVTNNAEYAAHAKHLSTTAKVPHAWLFEHDEIGYNLRMPNINAALGVAQMQKIEAFIEEKNQLALAYNHLLAKLPLLQPLTSPYSQVKANHWLMGLLCEKPEHRDVLLESLNQQGIQARPLWTPLHLQTIYEKQITDDMSNTEWLAQRLINLPSGVVCQKV